jgi:hypothetical protein
MRHLAIAVLGLVALAAAVSVDGTAADGLGPDHVRLDAASDESGFVTKPKFVDLRLAVTPEDGDVAVWVARTPDAGPSGAPAHGAVGSCVRAELLPTAENGVYTCRVPTSLFEVGLTYHWWIVTPGIGSGQTTVVGPFSFVFGTRVGDRASDVTAGTAARLPTRARFTGCCSVKHGPLTAALARAFRLVRPPRTLAVACWTDADFVSVLAHAGIARQTARTRITGIWLSDHPRWLQLSSRACRSVELLRTGHTPSGYDAFGLAIALHEAAHAYGVMREAQATCYAVQLVPAAARALGIRPRRAVYLGSLAVRYARTSSPSGYWNATSCRDGGAWDLPHVGTGLDPHSG